MPEEGEVVIYTDSHSVFRVSAGIGHVSVPTRIRPTSERKERGRSLHPTGYLRVVGADRDGTPPRRNSRGAASNGDC